MSTSGVRRASISSATRILTRYSEVTGAARNGSSSDSDLEVLDEKPAANNKRKIELGTKLKWSDEEEDGEDVYAKFKASKKTKRQKVAAHNKRVNAKAKAIHEEKKRTKKNGEEPKERLLGDQENYEDMGVDIPDYVKNRRKKFDDSYQELSERGLRLPPSYEVEVPRPSKCTQNSGVGSSGSARGHTSRLLLSLCTFKTLLEFFWLLPSLRYEMLTHLIGN